MSMYKYFLALSLIVSQSFCFGQANRNRDTSYSQLQNKIGGTYVGSLDTEKDTTYFYESITFKYGTDSFFYWNNSKWLIDQTAGFGKGTYKISGKKLYLNFENSDVVPALKTRVNIIKQKSSRDSNKIITVQGMDSSGLKAINYISAVLLNKNRDTVYRHSLDSHGGQHTFMLKDSDFPVTGQAIYIGCKPCSFTIEKSESYNVNICFQPYQYAELCNGEKWEYDILDFPFSAGATFLEVRLSGEFPASHPKTLVLSSYQKASDNRTQKIMIR
ncbi:hypothetical protein [Pinibacter soli]|uniref:DUF4377 domain-containing protein n=1 Tax=Pinibacter soli TaxID=3044211 RepID=A0ABT6R7D9_9BACT|nr:hypothetical protein [Pinibacter soli]MDI3318489.1 hypothetical protein [Pinibacter soli]